MVQLALSQLYVTIFALVEIKNLALNLNSVCVWRGGGQLSTGSTLEKTRWVYFDIKFTRGLPSDSTCILKAEPGKLDIKRWEPGILSINWPIVSLFKPAIMTCFFCVDSASFVT